VISDEKGLAIADVPGELLAALVVLKFRVVDESDF
jgi:hypothetical protein